MGKPKRHLQWTGEVKGTEYNRGNWRGTCPGVENYGLNVDDKETQTTYSERPVRMANNRNV